MEPKWYISEYKYLVNKLCILIVKNKGTHKNNVLITMLVIVFENKVHL